MRAIFCFVWVWIVDFQWENVNNVRKGKKLQSFVAKIEKSLVGLGIKWSLVNAVFLVWRLMLIAVIKNRMIKFITILHYSYFESIFTHFSMISLNLNKLIRKLLMTFDSTCFQNLWVFLALKFRFSPLVDYPISLFLVARPSSSRSKNLIKVSVFIILIFYCFFLYSVV